ncbi:hypothetical protein [Demequina capsici]|uniref:DUF5667 domain-containing protein n=1 Tax=Demequina capsici TaxID=3075620 RepID=A0AA96FA22_9MICO|nr:hypothetical protein [Demequina sp. OYTSA14]WNM24395.1 hypothetical protein RN606_13680 [Demequina sp. OYTSA14]
METSRNHTKPTAGMSRLRRNAIAAASVAGLAALAVGGAAAADEAKPGDPLYSVDRALETVGINDGGSEERLAETQELVDEGELDLAVETADEAVDDMGDLDETDATDLTGLLNAAQSVLSEGSDQSLERRTQVAEMLTFMATTELTGKEFGQAVSQHARGTWVDDAAPSDESADPSVDPSADELATVDPSGDPEASLSDEAAEPSATAPGKSDGKGKSSEHAKAKPAKAAKVGKSDK